MCQDNWQSQDLNLDSLAPKPVPLTTTKCHPVHAYLISKQSGAQQGIMMPTLQTCDRYPKMVSQLQSQN